MRTITIQIQVPDGVGVKVTQGGGDDDFVEREAPDEPDGACPEHGTPWRLVKAGVSKRTGKRYNAFWACSTQGCNIKPGDKYEGVEEISFR